MKTTLPYLSIVFLFTFGIIQKGITQYNPSPYIVNDNKGLITFDSKKTSKDDLRFHIFGTGYYSYDKSPSHQFNADNYTDSTSIFYLRTYKPNKPTEKRIAPKGGGYKWYGKDTNPKVTLTGDIDIKESWSPASHVDNEHFYMLVFENKNNEITNGCVEFHYNSSEVDIDLSNIRIYHDWMYNQTVGTSSEPGCDSKIRWQFDDLKYGVQRVIYIPTEVNVTEGSTITRIGKYFDDCQGTATYSDSDSSDVLRYPHDPNFKEANRSCILANIPEQQQLEYLINFHNDGNGPAGNVYVSDVIPMELDLNSFVFLDSEYPCIVNVDIASRTIYFNFIGINLPGLDQDDGGVGYTMSETSSWFKFKICSVANLPTGQCILNQAAIVFDTQPVFYTDPSRVCATTFNECSLGIICP